MIGGVAVFTLASLFNGLAQSPGMLIGGRVVQGLEVTGDATVLD